MVSGVGIGNHWFKGCFGLGRVICYQNLGQGNTDFKLVDRVFVNKIKYVCVRKGLAYHGIIGMCVCVCVCFIQYCQGIFYVRVKIRKNLDTLHWSCSGKLERKKK